MRSRAPCGSLSASGCLSWFGTVCDGVHTICSALGKYGIRVGRHEVEGGMRRRSRRSPNTSESTGKIGQELPLNQLAPLVPFYPDEAPAARPAEQAPQP